jgi:hypothetical protein
VVEDGGGAWWRTAAAIEGGSKTSERSAAREWTGWARVGKFSYFQRPNYVWRSDEEKLPKIV